MPPFSKTSSSDGFKGAENPSDILDLRDCFKASRAPELILTQRNLE